MKKLLQSTFLFKAGEKKTYFSMTKSPALSNIKFRDCTLFLRWDKF